MDDAFETIELHGGPVHGTKLDWRGGDQLLMSNDDEANRVMRVVSEPPSHNPQDLLYVRCKETRTKFVYQP
jgi:hypothetical protein